ncbi:MAG: CvpA family protein [Bacteroidota bacterium]|jgi:membrane protein required for colicin V production
MAIIDIIIGIILLLFAYSGFKSGFIKKIIGITCLVLALILGTKYAADVNSLLFEEIGISGSTGFFLSFLVIVIAITLTQSIFYKLFVKDFVDAMWNNVLGLFVGALEGAISISIALIVLSIYLELPSNETKAESEFYKPLKNFAPMVFDQMNTLLPESEDFYQQIMDFATDEIQKMEKK